MTYRGHIKNGVVVLDDPVPLPEGAEVTIDLSPGERVVPLSESMQGLIGKVEDLPPDAAAQKRHYLYGHAKS